MLPRMSALQPSSWMKMERRWALVKSIFNLDFQTAAFASLCNLLRMEGMQSIADRQIIQAFHHIISIFWSFFVFYHILVIYSQNSVMLQSHWIPFALSFTDFHLATGSCHRFHGLGHGRSVWVWILGCFCLSAILWIWSLARPVSSQGERN